MPSYIWNTATTSFKNLMTGELYVPPTGGVDNDWSDAHLPWAYTSTSQFTEQWPQDVDIVDIETGSGDFYTNLTNTVSHAGRRVVVRLGQGVYSLNQFRMYGSSGNPTYAFGFFIPNLRGFLGQGPDKTFIQMNANSMSQAQLDYMATMNPSDFVPLGMGMCRLDGSSASPVLLGGLTFRSADQQMLTAKHPNLDVVVPQPAPHHGLVLFRDSHARVAFVRFQAAGRALSSAPPFECGNVSSQYGDIRFYNCEFDGRRSADLDPLQPRRCTTIMGNNETYHLMQDCWLHHTNVSRYAVNDENRETQGEYILTRCKVERVGDTRNTDPALNGGVTLGGYTDPSALGWESVNGTITLNHCIVSQDNSQFLYQSTVPQHLQLTSVGSRNPRGGRLYVNGGEFRDRGWPELDGFLRFRVSPSTYWWIDGVNTTIFAYNQQGTRLIPYQITSPWPPDASALAASGITPQTHYLVRAT